MFNNLEVADAILSAIKKDFAQTENVDEFNAVYQRSYPVLLMVEGIMTKMLEE